MLRRTGTVVDCKTPKAQCWGEDTGTVWWIVIIGQLGGEGVTGKIFHYNRGGLISQTMPLLFCLQILLNVHTRHREITAYCVYNTWVCMAVDRQAAKHGAGPDSHPHFLSSLSSPCIPPPAPCMAPIIRRKLGLNFKGICLSANVMLI